MLLSSWSWGNLQAGEVTRLDEVARLSIKSLIWSFHLSCKRDKIKMRADTDRQVTPAKRVTSPTWCPPPPGKQLVFFLGHWKYNQFSE